jgi:hypothetical protein
MIEIQRVSIGHFPLRNRDTRRPGGECKGLQDGGDDGGDTCFVIPGDGKGGRGYGEVGAAKGVGDLDADAVGGEGHVEGLTEGGICEDCASGFLVGNSVWH